MQVRSRETSAEKLMKTLRELPTKEALALRSEVATQVSFTKPHTSRLHALQVSAHHHCKHNSLPGDQRRNCIA